MAFLPPEEITSLGFASVGSNVCISEHAAFHNCARMVIGSNVRIDDFCILSAGTGGIHIGSHVHIAAYTSLIGRGLITLGDYSNLSSKVSIYSSSDDYSGLAMTNPTIPTQFTHVMHADVTLEAHVIVGCGSVILPGVHLGIGAAIGALTLVKDDCEAFGIYCGTPAKWIKSRDRTLLSVEQQYLASLASITTPN